MSTNENTARSEIEKWLTGFTDVVRELTEVVLELKERMNPPEKEYLTFEDVMEKMDCSRSSIYNFIRQGKLRRLKWGKLARFRREEVEELLSGERRNS
ncbi:MAG: helix-turn-helix domain-containing protein [Lentisphaerae bacterium]|jgi:excisionase family DNA binding protein|nr:helix-turn-helix domain-containing protein [Lentisphaerota bacterium]MBT7056477.1 helix-turn-helix domain-containing protein [Lentisphaerota bacterium]MBT7840708.1 helix-turn-helix domain-containing protein [Lentisphaerota bacterium]